MVIWQGKGFVGVLVPFAFILAGQFGLDAALGQGYYSSHNWAPALFLALSAPVVWFCGRKLGQRPKRELIDVVTHQRVVLQEKHTIFWLSLEHFSILILALALFGLLQ